MQQLLLSFGCGICFALGAVVGVTVASLIRSKDREDYAKEMKEHAKRVEDRLAVQVSTMAACLVEIEKRKDA